MKKLVWLLLLLSAPTWAQVVNTFEEPVVGNIYAGVANIRGWAVSDLGVDRVEYSIDGGPWMQMPYGGSRQDVGDAYPGYPDSDHSGYSMAFNYDNLDTGPHYIKVRVCDADGCVPKRADFLTVKFDQGFVQQVDLSEAVLEVVDNEIYINGMRINDVFFVVRLGWLAAGQNFMPVEITPIGDNPDGHVVPPGVSYSYHQAEFLQAINAVRAAPQSCGGTSYPAVPSLQWDIHLAEAALAHSIDMASNNFFSHTGSDGSSFSARVGRTDFSGWPRSENIGAGYSNVQAVVQGWVSSAGHCRNLMDSSTTHFGAALAEKSGTQWTKYWTFVGGSK